MTALLTGLIAWVAVATGYPAVEPPIVTFKDKCTIAAIYSPKTPCENVPVVAMYIGGTMFLPDTWDGSLSMSWCTTFSTMRGLVVFARWRARPTGSRWTS